ncbi:serine hydrolase domain-containing protein [Spongiivirga citrea]|uniref:Serine hydrolase n=1 Tax=Spongiivirga citrea TaxID=1481457 RepID=A0A6M0CI84_9FLAO|nr:serine hydrolase domain-containing protein [Spongiivirga citrea]NER17678.1 serine hydrolase [Spongiivirga citrea]
MKKLQLIMFLLFVTTAIVAQEESHFLKANSHLKNAIDKGECMGIAAGIIVKDSVVWTGAAGLRNKSEKLKFTTANTSRIASIAKPMTAVAIMQLVEANKIKLTDSIVDIIPELKDNINYQNITVLQLLQHSSGIPHYAGKKEVVNSITYLSLKGLIPVFLERELLFTPGTQFEYSVYGYVLLGRVIEVVSGLKYQDYMKTHVWDVAGMNDTKVNYTTTIDNQKSVLYHQSKPGRIKEAKANNLSNRIPAGGVVSTVDDLLKFAKALIDHKLVSENSLEMMSKNYGLEKKGSGYGLGWYLYGENPKLGNVIGHTGGQYGCSAFLMIAPEKKSAVVAVSNTSGAMQEVSNITVSLLGLVGKLNED